MLRDEMRVAASQSANESGETDQSAARGRPRRGGRYGPHIVHGDGAAPALDGEAPLEVLSSTASARRASLSRQGVRDDRRGSSAANEEDLESWCCAADWHTTMSLEDKPQFQPGDLVGERCRVVRLIGRGGMGEVYEAENTWTGRRVAVKVLLPGANLDSRAVGRFVQEAQAATRLNHRNIIDVFDMGRDTRTDLTYLVQELLSGESLRERFERDQRLSVRASLDLLLPVMGALAAAHHGGIIHRDVKPENIFLHHAEGELVPKLIDFGLAKALDGDQRLTHTGQILGTPLYMAPEQCEGRADIDERADIWAVGVMLYEALSGVSPFSAATVMGVLFNIVHRPAAPFEVPGVDASLVTVVLRALKVPREERYATMEEFARALLDCDALRAEVASIREQHRRSLRFVSPSVAPPPSTAAPAAPTIAANASGTEQGWTSNSTLREGPALTDTLPQTAPVVQRSPNLLRRAAVAGATAAIVVLAWIWSSSRGDIAGSRPGPNSMSAEASAPSTPPRGPSATAADAQTGTAPPRAAPVLALPSPAVAVPVAAPPAAAELTTPQNTARSARVPMRRHATPRREPNFTSTGIQIH